MWILCCIQWRVSLRQWWERYRFLRLVKPGPLQLDCVVSSDIPGFLAMLTCCPAGRLCQHSLPHSCSPFAHCFWAKMSSVLLYIPREIYPQPIAWGGPVTEVSAQALACMSAPQCSAAQGRVAQACVDTAVGKICICKSLSAKLGSFRHPIAFDQPARVVIHSFLQKAMSTWYFLSGCELPLLTFQAVLQHADGDRGLTEKLGHGHCKHVQLLSGTLQVSLSTLLSSLSSKHGQMPLCCLSHQLTFHRAQQWCPAPWAHGPAGAQPPSCCGLNLGSYPTELLVHLGSTSMAKSSKLWVHYPHLGAIDTTESRVIHDGF